MAKSDENYSLPLLIDWMLNKDEVSDILYSLDEKVSGSKKEVVDRLIKATSSLSLEDALSLFNKDRLKDFCQAMGLSGSGNKGDLIDRIIQEESFIDSRKKPSSKISTPKQNIVNVNVNQTSPNDNLLFNILIKYMTKDDLERGLNKCGLKTNGSKNDQAFRLLDATANDPRETLMLMTGQSLNDYADKLKIPRRRSKEDQVDDILVKVFKGETKPIKTAQSSSDVRITTEQAIIPTHPVIRSLNNTDLFDLVIKEIIDWVPVRGYKSEEGYQTDLFAYLRGKGHQVESEVGQSRIDILVDNIIPIELKKSPSIGELDRAEGQLNRHWHAYGSVILVICRPTFSQDIDDFERRFDITAKALGMKYKIVKKG